MLKEADLICDETLPRAKSPLKLLNGRVEISREDITSLPIELPDEVSQRLKGISQVALKNIYLGQSIGEHHRWNHSKGVYTLGLIWLKTLYKDNRLPERLTRPPFPDYETAQVLLGFSLLLHDYGHLFFSHLLQEALRVINWVPRRSGVTSLEYSVLQDRLQGDDQVDKELHRCVEVALARLESRIDSHVVEQWNRALQAHLYTERGVHYIIQLVFGWSGLPWLQAIVNGPIDADKIDYIRRDQEFLSGVGYHVQSRLQLSPEGRRWMPWTEEFLSEQFVNHQGFLCLPGRSALAAAELLRERIFLYDRFYLAPEIRAADRIVLEIVQQFLIRCVMSRDFAGKVLADPNPAVRDALAETKFKSLEMTLHSDHDGPVDLIERKYQEVRELLTGMSKVVGHGDDRDWPALKFMLDHILDEHWKDGIDEGYRQLIKEGFQLIQELKDSGNGPPKLSLFADKCIVEQPLQFHKTDEREVRDVARSAQNQYAGEVLIDVSGIPDILSIPRPAGGISAAADAQGFAQILVPMGPVENWGHGQERLEPLETSKVKSLERPYGRIVVVAPGKNQTARSRYIFDRLRESLRRRNVPIFDPLGIREERQT